MLLHIGTERLAAGGLDRATDPVGTHAVQPVGSRFEHQRRRNAGDAGGSDLALRFGHIRFGERIAETRGMGEQMPERNRRFRGFHYRLAVPGKAGQHIGIGQFGQDRADRFVQRQKTPFHQLHGSDGCDRFGHGSNLEDAIQHHWLAGSGVRKTRLRRCEHPVGIANHGNRAGYLLVGQRPIQGFL